MKQAVKDLKNLYGRETIDSDEGRQGGSESDSDSEGLDELQKQSAFMKQGASSGNKQQS